MKILAVNTKNYHGNSFIQSSANNKGFNFEDTSGFEQQQISHQAVKTNLPLDTIILPTFSSLEKISDSLSEILAGFFSGSGFSTNSPVDITVDQETNEIKISGDREDTALIEEMINYNEDLKDKILTVNAIASHVCQMPEHLAFQKEYFESDNPDQVLAKYSHLFNDNVTDHSLSFKFNSGKLEIYFDNKLWNYK